MKKRFWEHQIPTIPALLLVIIGLWATVYLIQSGTFITTKASPDQEPVNVVVGNITESSFTVAFTTATAITAAIQVIQPNGQELIVYDDRNSDDPAAQSTHKSHIFTVTNLSPATQYTYSIIAEGKIYNQNGQPYAVNTAPVLNQNPASITPIKGTVLQNDGQPADDTLLVIVPEGGNTMISVTSQDGSYDIALTQARTQDLQNYLTLSAEQQISLKAIQGGSESIVNTLYENSNPVPVITLSQDYSFTDTSEEPESPVTGEFSIPESQESSTEITITNPEEGESFIDDQPTFRGTALPNSQVSVRIQSNEILEAEVLSDKNGSWSYRPTSPLPQGQRSITIRARDSSGITRSVTRSFSIFPSGSQVIQPATQSASPTQPAPSPTPTSQPSPTPGVTAAVTPSPTAVITNAPTQAPTSTPTIEPTNTPMPTSIITVTPTPPGSGATVVVTLLSVLLIIAGTTLLFIIA